MVTDIKIKITNAEKDKWYNKFLSRVFSVAILNEELFIVSDGEYEDATIRKRDVEIIDLNLEVLKNLYQSCGYQIKTCSNGKAFEIHKEGQFRRWFYSLEGLNEYYKYISNK